MQFLSDGRCGQHIGRREGIKFRKGKTLCPLLLLGVVATGAGAQPYSKLRRSRVAMGVPCLQVQRIRLSNLCN